MTQQDDSIARRLSRIEAQLARIEELLISTRGEDERESIATQEQCYDAWIHYLNSTLGPSKLTSAPMRWLP